MLDSNSFTGSIPDSWVQLAELQRVTVQPGNSGMCTVVPASASFSVCQAGSASARSGCEAPAPTAGQQCDAGSGTQAVATQAAAAGSSSSSSSDGSSFPVAAVAAPVAIVGAAALAAVGYLGWRRRKRAISTASGADMERGGSKELDPASGGSQVCPC